MTREPAKSADASLVIGPEGRVFREPWEAQAFAIVVALQQQGLVSAGEWAEALGREIRAAQMRGDPDTGDTYYHHWLAALESVVAAHGLTDLQSLDLYREAWKRAAARTPHGTPIELSTADFEPVTRPRAQ